MAFYFGIVCASLLSLANARTTAVTSTAYPEFDNCGFNLNATCDDKMKLFADGYLLAESDDWKKTSMVYIPPNTEEIEIRCIDGWILGGILASSDNGLITNNAWNCSSDNGTTWNNAHELGANGVTAEDISADAKWIWTDRPTWTHTAHKRHTTAICTIKLPTNSVCGTTPPPCTDCVSCLFNGTTPTPTPPEPTQVSGFNFNATCNNKMELFVDGNLLATSDNWRDTSQVHIPANTQNIEIHCTDSCWLIEGILASSDNGLLTDDSWNCSSDNGITWSSAHEIVLNGLSVPDISPNAKWISTGRNTWKDGGKVICKAMLAIQSVSPISTTAIPTGPKLEFQLKGLTGQEKVTISVNGNEEELILTKEWQTFSYPRPSKGFFSVEFHNDNGPRDVNIQGHESQVADLLPEFINAEGYDHTKVWGCGTVSENERCTWLRNGKLRWDGKYTYTLKGCPYNDKYVECPEFKDECETGNFANCMNRDCAKTCKCHWSAWGSWSECSATCGIAVKSRKRKCLQLPCPPGRTEEVASCHLPSCGAYIQQKCFLEDTNITFLDLGRNHMHQDQPPVWKIADNGRSLTETLNTRPSIGLSNLGDITEPVSFSGRVYSASGDDDVIGMVFGFWNEANFFVIASARQHPGPTNWYVARLHATCTPGLSCATTTTISDAIWDPPSHPEDITVLATGNTPWQHGKQYNFTVCFNPSKLLLSVSVTNENDAGPILETGIMSAKTNDSGVDEVSRKGGFVGVYVDSQARTTWDYLICQDCHLIDLPPSKDSIYFIAGGVSSERDIELYDPSMANLSCSISPPPLNNDWRFHTTFYYNNTIYLYGGNYGTASTSISYNPGTKEWKNHILTTSKRYGHSITILNKRIYIIGGRNSSSNYVGAESTPLPLTDRPVLTPVSNMDYRGYHQCTTKVDEENLVVTGGHNRNYLSSVIQYNAKSRTTTLLPSLKQPRLNHGCALVEMDNNKSIIVAGGQNSAYLKTTEMLQIGESSWTYLGDLNVARHGHSIAVTQRGVMAMGGLAQSGSLNSVELLDWSAKSWRIVEPSLSKSRYEFGGAVKIPASMFDCRGEGVLSLSSQYVNSLNEDFTASKCLDGDLNTMCVTTNERYPYIMMEYPKEVLVKKVKVVARADKHANRVRQLVVSVTNVKPTRGQLVSGGKTMGTFAGPASPSQEIIFTSEAGLRGKYVVIQQGYTGFINYAEIEITKETPGVLSLSSQYVNIKNEDFTASQCLDGNLNTMCHTTNEKYPFLVMEYPYEVLVKRVKVVARAGKGANRVKQLVVSVTNIKPTQGQLVSGGKILGTFAGPATPAEEIMFTSEAGLRGKYVVIQQEYTGIINYAEIEITKETPGQRQRQQSFPGKRPQSSPKLAKQESLNIIKQSERRAFMKQILPEQLEQETSKIPSSPKPPIQGPPNISSLPGSAERGSPTSLHFIGQTGWKLEFQLKGKTGIEKVKISVDNTEEEIGLTTDWRLLSYPRPTSGLFSVEFLNDIGYTDVFIRGHESQVTDLLPNFPANEFLGCGTTKEDQKCGILRKGTLMWNGKYTYTLKGQGS